MIVGGVAVIAFFLVVLLGAATVGGLPPQGTCDALSKGAEWAAGGRLEEAGTIAGLGVTILCGLHVTESSES